jgi:hypothetical protein
MDKQIAAVGRELLMAQLGFAPVLGYAPLAWSTLVESRRCRESTMRCPPDNRLMQIKQSGQTNNPFDLKGSISAANMVDHQ